MHINSQANSGYIYIYISDFDKLIPYRYSFNKIQQGVQAVDIIHSNHKVMKTCLMVHLM